MDSLVGREFARKWIVLTVGCFRVGWPAPEHYRVNSWPVFLKYLVKVGFYDNLSC